MESEYYILSIFLESILQCYENVECKTYGNNLCLFRIKGIEIDNNLKFIIGNSCIIWERKNKFTHVFYCQI